MRNVQSSCTQQLRAAVQIQRVNWQQWKVFFERRASRPIVSPDEGDANISFPASLARSLAIFQLGESGGGTIIGQARCSTITEIDDDYADAMALFVKEENRHADVLATCVFLLGGTLIEENWTAKWFVRDETSHLYFHCQFLRTQTTSAWRQYLFVLVWRSTMLAAALAVMFDHREAIRDMSLDFRTVWQRWMAYSRLAEQLVVDSAIDEIEFETVRY